MAEEFKAWLADYIKAWGDPPPLEEAWDAGRSYEKTAHGGCCHSEGTPECVSLERPETAAPTTEAGDTASEG